MTDDISKVVREWRAETKAGLEKVMDKLQARISELESATPPAEVDKVSELILSEYFADKRNGVGDYWARDMAKEAHEKIVATLARQLAEAKAEAEKWRMAEGRAVSELQRELHESNLALREATRRLGEVEGLVGEWRNEAEANKCLGSSWHATETRQLLADELESALTKEPAK